MGGRTGHSGFGHGFLGQHTRFVRTRKTWSPPWRGPQRAALRVAPCAYLLGWGPQPKAGGGVFPKPLRNKGCAGHKSCQARTRCAPLRPPPPRHWAVAAGHSGFGHELLGQRTSRGSRRPAVDLPALASTFSRVHRCIGKREQLLARAGLVKLCDAVAQSDRRAAGKLRSSRGKN